MKERGRERESKKERKGKKMTMKEGIHNSMVMIGVSSTNTPSFELCKRVLSPSLSLFLPFSFYSFPLFLKKELEKNE